MAMLEQVTQKIADYERKIEEEEEKTPNDRGMVLALRNELAELRKEKNRLAEAQVVPAPVLPGANFTDLTEAFSKLLTDSFQPVKESLNSLNGTLARLSGRLAPASKKRKKMSSVGSTEAESFTSKLGLVWVEGDQITATCIVDDFGMHRYRDEAAATPQFLKWFEGELDKVSPGFKQRFKVQDMHRSTSALSIRNPDADMEYVGFMDGVVVPKSSLSYNAQSRLGIELKHNQADKAKYLKDNPQGSTAVKPADELERETESGQEGEEQVGMEEEVQMEGTSMRKGKQSRTQSRGTAYKFKFTASVKGQATCKMLAACAMGQFPADLTVTDGHSWHILRIRGKVITLWQDLTTSQALTHFAETFAVVPAEPDFTADKLTDDKLKMPLEMLSQYLPAQQLALAGVAQQLGDIAGLGQDYATTIANLMEGIHLYSHLASAQDIVNAPNECRHIFM